MIRSIISLLKQATTAGMIFMIFGCNAGIYEILDRDISDPCVDNGVVESFKISNTITMSWKEDTGADSYIVERAIDAQNLGFKQVYEGNGLFYRDEGLPDGQRYIYRLKKTRGKKTFGPYAESFGVSSLITEDAYEPNNRKENAVLLSTNPLIMNMYYYQSYNNGLVISDEDWFCIDIPPSRKVGIIIDDSEIESGTGPTHFMLYEEHRMSTGVNQLIPVLISNTERVTQRLYFKIYLNTAELLPEIGGVGGKLIQYTIRVGDIVGL